MTASMQQEVIKKEDLVPDQDRQAPGHQDQILLILLIQMNQIQNQDQDQNLQVQGLQALLDEEIQIILYQFMVVN